MRALRTVTLAVLAGTAALAGCGHHDRRRSPPPKVPKAVVADGLIVFRATVDDDSQLFTVRPDGTGQRQITDMRVPPGNTTGPEQPSFAPDGARIAFDASAHSDSVDLFLARPDGSDAREVELSVGAYNGLPDYAPDGRRLVFGQDVGDRAPLVHGLYVADIDGTHVRRLTRGLRAEDAYDTNGAWSPDGRRIAFTRVANPQRTAIFIVDADGGHLERLTSWRLDAENPQWSPDGRRLIFQGHFDLATASDIFTMAPDGSEQRRLTHFRPGTNATEPYYAPDRKHVVWRKQGVSVDELFISDPELKTARRLTHFPLGSEPGSPEWWMP